MTLTKATIRNNGEYIVVDAVVDGVLQEAFVSYSGNTVEHENAATDYLLRCGLSFDDIEFEDYEIENSQEFVDGVDEVWTGREYNGYSHAAGYPE